MRIDNNLLPPSEAQQYFEELKKVKENLLNHNNKTFYSEEIFTNNLLPEALKNLQEGKILETTYGREKANKIKILLMYRRVFGNFLIDTTSDNTLPELDSNKNLEGLSHNALNPQKYINSLKSARIYNYINFIHRLEKKFKATKGESVCWSGDNQQDLQNISATDIMLKIDSFELEIEDYIKTHNLKGKSVNDPGFNIYNEQEQNVLLIRENLFVIKKIIYPYLQAKAFLLSNNKKNAFDPNNSFHLMDDTEEQNAYEVAQEKLTALIKEEPSSSLMVNESEGEEQSNNPNQLPKENSSDNHSATPPTVVEEKNKISSFHLLEKLETLDKKLDQKDQKLKTSEEETEKLKKQLQEKDNPPPKEIPILKNDSQDENDKLKKEILELRNNIQNIKQQQEDDKILIQNLKNQLKEKENVLEEATKKITVLENKTPKVDEKKLEEENKKLKKELAEANEKLKKPKKETKELKEEILETNNINEVPDISKPDPHAFSRKLQIHTMQSNSNKFFSGTVIENNKRWITSGTITNPEDAKQLAEFFVKHYVKSHSSRASLFYKKNTFERYTDLLIWATVNYFQISQHNEHHKKPTDPTKSLAACKAIFDYLEALPSDTQSLDEDQINQIKGSARVYKKIAESTAEAFKKDGEGMNYRNNQNRGLLKLGLAEENPFYKACEIQAESKTSFSKKMLSEGLDTWTRNAFAFDKNECLLFTQSFSNGQNLSKVGSEPENNNVLQENSYT